MWRTDLRGAGEKAGRLGGDDKIREKGDTGNMRMGQGRFTVLQHLEKTSTFCERGHTK